MPDLDLTDNHFHLVPLILGLAPTLIGSSLKWLQENSRTKRRSQLCARLAEVSKGYSEQEPGDAVVSCAHAALGREITAICAELDGLQAETKRTSHRTLYGWLSDTLLLYMPHGFWAWLVHITFYAGAICVLLGLLGVVAEHKDQDTPAALIGFFMFGLVLFGLQRLAVRLRKQPHT